MERTQRPWTVLTCAALVCLLVSCKGPTPQNPYTSEFYSGGEKILSFTGVIKGQVVLQVTPNSIDFRRNWGATSKDVRIPQHQNMPTRPGICYLELQQSPVSASIIEQPSLRNGFTCTIVIDHRLDEPGRYNFNLCFLSQPEAK